MVRPCAREIRSGVLLIGAALAIRPAASAAQASAAASIFTDDRLRGYSLSDGRPVGILDLSYDDQSGLYGTVSGSIVASRGEGLEPLALILNAGYAKRLSSGLTIDGGVTHSEYSRYSYRVAARSYSEAYAGLSGKLLTARIYVSPDYLRHGTIYGEINGNLPLDASLRLSGHVGLLVPFGRNAYDEYGNDVDWRIGVARQFGSVTVQAAWTAVRPGHDLDSHGCHQHRDAFVLGLTYAL